MGITVLVFKQLAHLIGGHLFVRMDILAFFVLFSSFLYISLGVPTEETGMDDNCTGSLFDMKEFREKAANKLENIKLQFDVKNLNLNENIRTRRDGYGSTKTVVRCKSSYTGLFSFLAIPLLMGDIMLEFMSMINIEIMIMTPEPEPPPPEEPAPTGNNNNNNNNNNGGGGDGGGDGGGMGGNNNNNMNMNGRSFSESKWKREVVEELYQNISSKEIKRKIPKFVESYFDPKVAESPNQLPWSGDWTDITEYIQDIRGPFSGVLGWDNVGDRNLLFRKLRGNLANKRLIISGAHQLVKVYKNAQQLCSSPGNGTVCHSFLQTGPSLT